ncbi:MAG: DNA primase [Tissierellia bacterium]|nr:DNA primase [Tissierellia bacterium]
MSYISDEKKQEILDKADIVAVVGEYVDLKKSGSSYVGLCPFHNDKNPSFSVSESRGTFRCFACNEGGDVISFIMKIENVGFMEALKILADKTGVTLDYQNEEDKKKSQRQKLLYDINREVMMHFYKNLLTSKRAVDYLKKRKLNSKVVNTFMLGYAKDGWDDLLNFAKEKGYLLDDLVDLGLLSKTDNGRYYDKYRDRLIFPIISHKSKIIGFGGRILTDKKPKYLNSPENEIFQKRYNLYALNIFKRQNDKRIILVEGYMDVIALNNRGIENAVASLGTAFTKEQANLIKRYSDSIYICYDSDQAGINATKKAIDVFRQIDVNPKIIELTEGLDPDEYVQKYGVEGFNYKIENAKDSYDYELDKIFEIFENTKDKDKNSKINLFIDFLAKIESNILIDRYLNEIGKRLDVDQQAIKKDLYNRKKILNTINKDKNEVTNPIYTKEVKNLNSQIDVLNVFLNNRDSYYKYQKLFDNFLNDDRLLSIKHFIEVEDECNLKKIQENFAFSDYKSIIERLYNIKDIPVKELVDLILRLKRQEVKRKFINKEIDYEKVQQEQDLINFYARGKTDDKRKQ